MTTYLVKYDVTEWIEEYFEGDDGDDYYEDHADSFSEETTIEADSEEEAREQAYSKLLYDDVYVWSVEPLD